MSNAPSYMGVGAVNPALKKLSTVSTNCALSVNDADQFLIWNGQTSAARITLPTPEFGLRFIIILNADAASSGTIITATSNYDIMLAGSSYANIQFGSTSEEGQVIEVIGTADNRYIALPRALSSGAGGVWAGATT